MLQQIKEIILKWYQINKRELPWRNTSDPYFIWLSEIILQQTRVQQGTAYYLRFTQTYPTIKKLAMADEQTVLNLWQGLGYYSRSRNLHATAKLITSKYNGIFPDSYTSILELKGVGSYTAAAIASFAYNLPHAVVDGNVYRVLSRLFDVLQPIDTPKGKKVFQSLADELLNLNDPASHNQAMMEFGATICLPKKPLCITCPVQALCMSKQKNTIDVRPVKSKKIKVSAVQLFYSVQQKNNSLLLRKRTGAGIWQNLYEFPQLKKPNYSENLIAEQKHLLSHQKLTIQYYNQTSDDPTVFISDQDLVWVKKTELNNYPFPKPMQSFLDEFMQIGDHSNDIE